jgi:hypothetical protein
MRGKPRWGKFDFAEDVVGRLETADEAVDSTSNLVQHPSATVPLRYRRHGD